jgi:hypothetical protein
MKNAATTFFVQLLSFCRSISIIQWSVVSREKTPDHEAFSVRERTLSVMTLTGGVILKAGS